jgi:hypothetical protein
VRNESDIALVDPHTERDGAAHHHRLAAGPPPLRRLALVGGQAGVKRLGKQTGRSRSCT